MSGVNVFTSTARKMLDKMATLEDPVLRYSLLFQLIRFLIEGGINYSIEALDEQLEDTNDDLHTKLSSSDSKDIDDKSKRVLKRKIHNLNKSKDDLTHISKTLNMYLDGFNKWIFQPIYSPDHPLGHQLMNQTKTNFEYNFNKD